MEKALFGFVFASFMKYLLFYDFWKLKNRFWKHYKQKKYEDVASVHKNMKRTAILLGIACVAEPYACLMLLRWF